MATAAVVKPVCGTHDLNVLDLASKRLSEFSMSMPRSFPEDYGLTFLDSYDKFMLAGGCASGTYAMLPYVSIITISAREAREVASLPLGLKGIRLVYSSGSVYCIGGCAEGREHIETQRSCYVYIEKYDTWVRMADLSQGVVFPGAIVREGEIWVTGGYVREEQSSHVVDLIQIYSVSRNEWRIASVTLLRPSYLHGCYSLPTGELLVFCGLRDSNSNRFSYKLGSEVRSILPDRVSMSILDPPVLFEDALYAFNDEMSLLVYSPAADMWSVIVDPETNYSEISSREG